MTPEAAALVRAIRRAISTTTEWGTDNGVVSFRVRDIYEFAVLLQAEGVTVDDEKASAA